MSNALTSAAGRIWIQPGGPGNPVYLLTCKDTGGLTAPASSSTVLQCFDDEGEGWNVVGETKEPPGAVTFSLETLLFDEQDLIEQQECPYSLYVLSRDCGRADVFGNYIRGQILTQVKNTQESYTNLVMREEDSPTTLGIDLEAWPPLLKVFPLTASRIAITEVQALNDIYANLEKRCYGGCGDTLTPGEDGLIACDSAAGPATANVLLSGDKFETVTNAATDPFAAGLHILSAVRFYIGRSTVRLLVGMDSPVGAQGMVAYSDNNGATWTTVNVGGAVAGHGVNYSRGIWVNGERFILLASAAGYIYKSVDGGESWTAVESGTLTAGAYNQVHATKDKLYCIAGALADIISLSDDGGESWYAATPTGGGGDILTVWRFNKDRLMVGDDDGKLWQSFDKGVTWTQITGWTGSGTGDVRCLWFCNDHQGFMAWNSAAPVGKILMTINGGANWEEISTPTNTGLNAIFAPTPKLVYAVGEPQGGTGVLIKATS